ncbi:MAG: M28 family peptidase [Bacteroidales bacterium]|nr:M28 family peptidase [Bacteroidales bacterium]
MKTSFFNFSSFRLFFVIKIFLIFYCRFSYSQPHIFSSTSTDSSSNNFHFIINVLADDSMGGRYAGSIYEQKVEAFLNEYLLTIIHDDYSIGTDTFSYCCRNDSLITAHNLWLWPKEHTKKMILFAAHYDHLPPGSTFSKEIWNKNKIHPGADDNASGVAMAINIFKNVYTRQDSSKYAYALLLFSGHEEGLHGSKSWIEQHFNKSDSIVMMLNFDMVGRLSEETNIISLRMTDNNEYREQLIRASNQAGIRLMFSNEKFEDTDSYIFQQNGISAITVSTGIHNDYHKITDKPEKINYSGMEKIFDFINCFLLFE